ncbi:MAG: KaiC 1, partial [Phormidium sp.]
QITVMLTNLITGSTSLEHTEIGISSLMDTWLELRFNESSGERNRVLYVLKSRGMEHSNQVREFVLTHQGIELKDVYLGQETVLTGTARKVQEAKDQAASLVRQQEFERKRRELEKKQAIVRSQIEALQTQLELEQEEFKLMIEQEQLSQDISLQEQRKIANLRQADAD